MSTTTKEWFKTRLAEELLCLSERSLFRLRQKGILPAGRCWRRTIPDNINSNVIYNIPACLEVLSGVAAASEMEQDRLSTHRKSEVAQA
tara:strand:+ start:182 stop:448 length:267 start_codon:yes stop_codon:yes gene_type:complete